MTHYLIEFRFFGKAKYEMRQLITEVDQKFHLWKGHKVPHISLVGPFETNDEKRLVSDFERLCLNQEIMYFEVDGFNTFENNGVVFINIAPDKNLDEFRWQLSKTLQPYCNLKFYDYEREFKYHATIAMKLNPNKFKAIKSYINSKPKPKFKHILIRVTLIKNSIILCEYDFLLKRLLNRAKAKSSIVLSETFNKLREYKRLNKTSIPTENLEHNQEEDENEIYNQEVQNDDEMYIPERQKFSMDFNLKDFLEEYLYFRIQDGIEPYLIQFLLLVIIGFVLDYVYYQTLSLSYLFIGGVNQWFYILMSTLNYGLREGYDLLYIIINGIFYAYLYYNFVLIIYGIIIHMGDKDTWIMLGWFALIISAIFYFFPQLV